MIKFWFLFSTNSGVCQFSCQYPCHDCLANSAVLVAKDKELRKEFYRNAASQLDLLRAIGVTQNGGKFYTT